ncbi:MAG: hypothetical protein J0J03_11940 [Leifsonia sp.]|nr:hypothetical protein [Leifsonia sp.]
MQLVRCFAASALVGTWFVGCTLAGLTLCVLWPISLGVNFGVAFAHFPVSTQVFLIVVSLVAVAGTALLSVRSVSRLGVDIGSAIDAPYSAWRVVRSIFRTISITALASALVSDPIAFQLGSPWPAFGATLAIGLLSGLVAVTMLMIGATFRSPRNKRKRSP